MAACVAQFHVRLTVLAGRSCTDWHTLQKVYLSDCMQRRSVLWFGLSRGVRYIETQFPVTEELL